MNYFDASSAGTVENIMHLNGITGNGNSGLAVGGTGNPEMSFSGVNSTICNQHGTGATFVPVNVGNPMSVNSYITRNGNSNVIGPATNISNNAHSNTVGNASLLGGSRNNVLHSQNADGPLVSSSNLMVAGPSMACNNVLDNTTRSISMNGSSLWGLSYSDFDYVGMGQQHEFNAQQDFLHYGNINRQLSCTRGSVNIPIENSLIGFNSTISTLESMGNSHYMMDNHPSSQARRFLNGTLSNMHVQNAFQPQVDLQSKNCFVQPFPKQLASLPDDGYAMNAADLLPTGSMYHISDGGLSTNGSFNNLSRGVRSKNVGQETSSLIQQQRPQMKLQSQHTHVPQMGSNASAYYGILPLQSYQESQDMIYPYQQQQYQQSNPMQQTQKGSMSSKNEIFDYHSNSIVISQGQEHAEFLPNDVPEQKILDQHRFSGIASELNQQGKHAFAKQSQSSDYGLFDSDQLNCHSPQKSEFSFPGSQAGKLSNEGNDIYSRNNIPMQQESLSNESSLTQNASSSLHDHQSEQQGPEEAITKETVEQKPKVMENDSSYRNGPTMTNHIGIGSASEVAKDSKLNTNVEVRKQQYRWQQRFLLLLHHSINCSVKEGKCQKSAYCPRMKALKDHVAKCCGTCSGQRCRSAWNIIQHHMQCKERSCPVCVPVRQVALKRSRECNPLSNLSPSGSEVVNPSVGNGTCTNMEVVSEDSAPKSVMLEQQELKEFETSSLLSASKRPIQSYSLKKCIQPCSFVSHQSIQGVALELDKSSSLLNKKDECFEGFPPPKKQKIEFNNVKTEASTDNLLIKDKPANQKLPTQNLKSSELVSTVVESTSDNTVTMETSSQVEDMKEQKPLKEDHDTIISTKMVANVKESSPQLKQETAGTLTARGASLVEGFTIEQAQEHLRSLRQWVGQSKAKAEKYQSMEHNMTDGCCHLCAVERLTFQPCPIYCSQCLLRIKRNAQYYISGSSDAKLYLCTHCYNGIQGDTVALDGAAPQKKAGFVKKRNDEETEEAWVQCEKCKTWQHQICALFNSRRNEGERAAYICPSCYLDETCKGLRKPLAEGAVLGAKDLPKTLLSNHIEERLAKRLRQEREERSRALGKSYDEVPGAEALVVRVVSSLDKKLEVKNRFLELFQDEGYPKEYPYKSKVILLFQKIEGVEVCLFGMYVQEYGSDAADPNQRRLYIAYLDSVKYFRPDVKTATGEALRTFVYHEILIAYLEYSKERGFSSCYIWACPPVKGEDYILYCHPEIQKTPKHDKLREWYLAMLRKAMKEKIVIETTNIYDYFFMSPIERKAKVTTARLPYFDGDYWPGAIEEVLQKFEEEAKKNLKAKKTMTKRSMKAASPADPTSNSKDLLLMGKLGENIRSLKEDFIMVHLQHACSHCCSFITCGSRWVCKQCKSFELCDRCYDAEQKRCEKEKHPVKAKEKHSFSMFPVPGISADTKDGDDVMESEIFDTRQAFLSLCQTNHYQYDTLRRAKHSSMMILYHLHNPSALITCNSCQQEIETGKGWRCLTCPDFDICNACYQRNGQATHPHSLSPHHSTGRDQPDKERKRRILQTRKWMALLKHASTCKATCQVKHCRTFKKIFVHGKTCTLRAKGNCLTCKRMWQLLQYHARNCKESDCRVPRCRDLKNHFRALQNQADSRRRAAVNEMIRQRVAEASGSTRNKL